MLFPLRNERDARICPECLVERVSETGENHVEPMRHDGKYASCPRCYYTAETLTVEEHSYDEENELTTGNEAKVEIRKGFVPDKLGQFKVRNARVGKRLVRIAVKERLGGIPSKREQELLRQVDEYASVRR